jgi:hypothetical protein
MHMHDHYTDRTPHIAISQSKATGCAGAGQKVCSRTDLASASAALGGVLRSCCTLLNSPARKLDLRGVTSAPWLAEVPPSMRAGVLGASCSSEPVAAAADGVEGAPSSASARR